MKSKLIAVAIIPLVVTLTAQTYVMLKLNAQLNQLTDHLAQSNGLPKELQNFPTFSPSPSDCGNDSFQNHIESL